MNRLLVLHNKLRDKHGMRPLKLNSWLSKAAAIQAADQARRDVLSHTGSDGSDVGMRLNRVGYRWSYCEENAAEQPYAPGFLADVRTEDWAMSGWEASPGHLANMLNPTVTEFGAAYCDAASQTRYWTCVFARPAE